MRRPYTYYNITRVLLAILMVSSSICTWAQEPEPTKVAQIGDTPYATVADAISAATDGQTITLIAESEITESVTSTNTNSFTINLNGKTWNGNGETAALTQNATSGTISITGTSGSMGAICNTSGSLSISGGSFSGTITNNENATITITGGTFTGTITNNENATITITGGTFTGTITNTNGTITISDGTFTGTITNTNGTITISGGTFSQPVPEEYCASGYIPKDNGDGTYGVKAGSYVAKIGGTKYETIAEAIAAVTDDTETTIEILADIDANISIPAGKNINLVGGVHTVSGTITSRGTLTIVSGTYTNTTEDALKQEGEGTIIINAGVFSKQPDAGMIAPTSEMMVGESNTYIVAAVGTAEAKIVTTVDAESVTTLYQTIELAIAAAVTAGTETTITLLKDVAETIAIPAEAKITLELGDVTLTKNITNSGTLNITGGTISGAITNNSGTLTITSGTISGAITNEGTLTIASGNISGAITNAVSATMTISGGTFTGTIANNAAKANLTINGGTFATKPENNNYTCASDHDLIYNGTKYVYDAISAAEAKIGSDSYYYTIAKAIEDASTNTVTLLKDPSTETIAIPVGANITLALNAALTKVIANSGELHIISGTTSGAIKIMTANATVIITSGVTHPAVQLDEALSAYVLKAISGTSIITYKAELKYSIQVGSGITADPQLAAANALISNGQLASGLSGLDDNQSIDVTITSVELTGDNVTSATFNVELSGANGELITTATNDITFRLPVSTSIQDGKWVNVNNATEAISGGTVNVGHFVEITTKNFPTFSYTILATEPVAQIGKTKYVSVAAAITAATSEQTITILKAITENIEIADSKTITLAGGKYTLSGTITNSGALTLASGTFSGEITANGGTITINGGSFSSSLTTDGGNITITNGTFASTCDFTETNGDIAISGGTFDNIPAVNLCADGYVPFKNGENKFNMTNNWKMDDATLIASINYYGSAGYTVATATYTRNVGMVGVGGNPAGTKYGTICLPFNITIAPTDETKLYKATSVSATKLTIEKVTIDAEHPIPAGTPLIFELSADAAITMKIVSTNAIINVAAPAATPANDNLLVGTYSETTISGDALTNKYYLNGDKFHQAVNSLKVPAFRAYLDITSSPSPAPSMLSIVKEGEDETTDIQQIEALETVTEVYDLNGRKQNGLQRGINILRRADGSTIKVIVK